MTVDVVQEREEAARRAFARLRARSGTHSPSVLSIIDDVPGLAVDVDACYLSNPYATDAFLDRFEADVLGRPGRLRAYVERYPRQNADIAGIVARFVGVPQEQVLVGNGAAELIQVLVGSGEGPVLVPVPTFSAYYEFAEPRRVVRHRLDKRTDFRLDPEALLAAVRRHRPSTVVLINPNNPDGGYVERGELLPLLDDLIAAGVAEVVVDESLVHFAETGPGGVPSPAPLLDRPGVSVVKSMSKDFGVAGLRIGYALLAPERVARLRRTGFLWNSNGLADFFVSLLDQPDFLATYEVALARYVGETRAFFARLRELPGVRVYPSRANFALLELVDGIDADDLVVRLLVRHGVYVRSCRDKVGLDGQFLRVASRTAAENDLVYDALVDCLTSGPS